MWNLFVYDRFVKLPVVKTANGNYLLWRHTPRLNPSRLSDAELMIAMRGISKVCKEFDRLEVIPA